MIPVIDPKWRTDTVVLLCQSMREARNYSAMPILADALQDADCDNEELLARLRGVSPSYQDDERLVAIIMSEKGEEAVKWLDGFGDRVGYKYDVVISAGTKYTEGSDAYGGDGSEDDYTPAWNADSEMYNSETRERYWKCVEIVAGVKTDEYKNEAAFVCPC